MKRTLILSLVVVLILSACKKNNEDNFTSIRQGGMSFDEGIKTLKGKWIAENTVYNEYDNSILIHTYKEPFERTLMDFQDNGNLVIINQLGARTLPYTIQNDSIVEFDGRIYEIRDLTAMSVILITRVDLGSGSYTEHCISLKRE
ncbi:hypothetical protein WG954_07830 [Lacibacter sp. H375]|uniref:hypothetical protein n=1 Tax=Lacibacter sp. H375 TaxID=3133424 RepID=UPI0030C37966